MSAWRRAISREPGADTDYLCSGPVPTQINLGQAVGHRTPNVVASMTIQEISLDKAGAPRDIVKPHGSSGGPVGRRSLQLAPNVGGDWDPAQCRGEVGSERVPCS